MFRSLFISDSSYPERTERGESSLCLPLEGFPSPLSRVLRDVCALRYAVSRSSPIDDSYQFCLGTSRSQNRAKAAPSLPAERDDERNIERPRSDAAGGNRSATWISSSSSSQDSVPVSTARFSFDVDDSFVHQSHPAPVPPHSDAHGALS